MFVLLLCAIWCCILASASGSAYSTLRDVFKTMGGCIEDTTWAKLPMVLYDNTALDTFHTWMIVWSVVTVVGLVAGVYVWWKVSKSLARYRPQPQYG